ncbi:MAG: lipid carrier--UDP-N-acetylgalactosaminyltransferase [Bacteroidetes bacterium]|nr:MAG: lipid carrier--UDP-N-acetylgalactosaminyltransferase [Bacteroidota bacterium]
MGYLKFKRVMDVVVALALLLLLSPLLVVVMVALLCTGEHYVFYFQKRVGREGREFFIWKFATMLKDSPNMGTGTVTVRNDPRILPLGGFLSKTKINELPQLVNILWGSMSLVGPRPLVRKGYDLYTEEVKKAIYDIRPGLSGIGSIIFRDEEKYVSQEGVDPVLFYREKIIPYKGALEMWYREKMSFSVDLAIVFLTVWVVLFPQSDLPYQLFKSLPPKPTWMA